MRQQWQLQQIDKTSSKFLNFSIMCELKKIIIVIKIIIEWQLIIEKNQTENQAM